MKILVINCGSSSLKYQLLDMSNEELICKGTYERIGEKSFLTHKINGEKYVLENPVKDHLEALKFSIEQLLNKNYPAIKKLDEINGIGHRIVQGGDFFKESSLIDDSVIKKIDELKAIAPVHNRAAALGIRACKEIMPNTPMVAVFDTSFHQTISKEKYIYPIPYKYYEEYKIRKYGAHGTSHNYVANRVAELLNKDIKKLKIINCHLGQGASLCAIKDGKSVETTMGLTPVAGIPMCARSGDMDPSVLTFIMKHENIKPDEMEELLNRKSGVYGVSGVSIDFRDIEQSAKQGNEKSLLAIELYEYKVACYISRMLISLQGCDAITFTAGIGENQVNIRKGILDNLKFLGIKIDEKANNQRGEEVRISTPDSKIEVWVVPTNEELMIARDTLRIISK